MNLPTDKPFLMNKHNFMHVPNTNYSREVAGDEFVPITLEQAKALDADRQTAGLAILREVVAENDAAALKAAEEAARMDAPDAKTPIPGSLLSAAIAEKDAEIARLKAEIASGTTETRHDLPRSTDPDEMTYDELKAAAAERGIDLGKTPRKADLISALKAAGAGASES